MLKQRSIEWRQLRAGDVTASKFATVLTGARTRPAWAPKWLGSTAAIYMTQLLFEKATGQFGDRGTAIQMRHGIEWEEKAREHAEIELRRVFDVDLQLAVGEFAYISHPGESGIGCSPDGVIGDEALLELKCPYDGSRHAAAILDGEWLSKEHRAQVQGSLWITGRTTYYLASYDHRYDHALHMITVERDDQFIDAELAPGVIRFRDLLTELYEQHFKQHAVEIPF